jgi:hypothetical protein
MARKNVQFRSGLLMRQSADESADIELGGESITPVSQILKMAKPENDPVVTTNGKGEEVSALAGLQVIANGKVTQTTLRQYLDLKRKEAELQAEMDAKVADLVKQKAEVESKALALQNAFLKAWEDGFRADVGPGKVTLSVVEQAVRTSPKWKDEALVLASQAGKDVLAFEASVMEKYKKLPIKVVKVL